eukprot:351613-Chlamydomonas_euryale.AAC.5
MPARVGGRLGGVAGVHACSASARTPFAGPHRLLYGSAIAAVSRAWAAYHCRTRIGLPRALTHLPLGGRCPQAGAFLLGPSATSL